MRALTVSEVKTCAFPFSAVFRLLLAHWLSRLEGREPLARLAHLGAVRPELVDVPAVHGGPERQLRREDLVLLRDQQGSDLRDVLLGPRVVLHELRAEPFPLDEIGVAPEVDELVERAELRRPRPLELPVLVAPRRAPDLRVELEVLALLARHQRVGPEFVDHGWLLPLWVIGTVQRACRRRSPYAGDSPPSPRRAGSA